MRGLHCELPKARIASCLKNNAKMAWDYGRDPVCLVIHLAASKNVHFNTKMHSIDLLCWHFTQIGPWTTEICILYIDKKAGILAIWNLYIGLSHFSIVLLVAYRWYRPPVAGIALPSLVSPSRHWYRPPVLRTIKSKSQTTFSNTSLTFWKSLPWTGFEPMHPTCLGFLDRGVTPKPTGLMEIGVV